MNGMPNSILISNTCKRKKKKKKPKQLNIKVILAT